MTFALPMLDHRGPEKPREFDQCNGCGMCCSMEPCRIARELLHAPEGHACPAMEFEHGRFWCGLVRSPLRYIGIEPWQDQIIGACIASMLGVGNGCDATDERSDPDAAILYELGVRP